MNLVKSSIGFEWNENDKLFKRRYMVYYLPPYSLTHSLSLSEDYCQEKGLFWVGPLGRVLCSHGVLGT